MHQCPACRSDQLHRSKPRTRWEHWRRALTQKRPYRCHSCGWRGWSVDLGPKFGDDPLDRAAHALATDPAQSPPRGDRAASFSDLDLDQLDPLEPIADK